MLARHARAKVGSCRAPAEHARTASNARTPSGQLRAFASGTSSAELLCERQPALRRQARAGALFHGDFERFDFGARASMRTVAESLEMVHGVHHSFSSRTDMNRGVQSSKLPAVATENGYLLPAGIPAKAQVIEAAAADATARAMLNASFCYAPQGDIMTSRRLFDAMAAGCVPVVVKAIGNSIKEALLGNLPFYHSVDWRQVGLFLAPRGTSRSELPGTPHKNSACRREESAWLYRQYSNEPLVHRLRHNAQASFEATMDIEYNPAGVVNAILQELPYIEEDAGIMLPAEYMRGLADVTNVLGGAPKPAARKSHQG